MAQVYTYAAREHKALDPLLFHVHRLLGAVFILVLQTLIIPGRSMRKLFTHKETPTTTKYKH